MRKVLIAARSAACGPLWASAVPAAAAMLPAAVH
jgi:hypothetical protein